MMQRLLSFGLIWQSWCCRDAIPSSSVKPSSRSLCEGQVQAEEAQRDLGGVPFDSFVAPFPERFHHMNSGYCMKQLRKRGVIMVGGNVVGRGL